ncbi:MAG: hypothetical protein Q4B64_05115 [Spirochaetales bacterium]|nr:hypothetical protein [Spirochaetales bacterium]
MDVVSAAMCLYLLFPILNERQQRYSEWINRNLSSSPSEVEKRLELVKFLELKENDYTVPEEIPLGEDYSEGKLSEGDGSDDGETVRNIVEVYLKDTRNHLKQFEYGEERFCVGDREGLRSSVVSVNGDTVTRTRYDSSYRMIESIVWKNGSSVADSLMLNKKNWFYRENAVYMTEDDFEAKTFADTVFNERKLPVKYSLYAIVENAETPDAEKKQKKNLSRVDYFEYDDQDQITLEREEVYEQRMNEFSGRQKDVIVYTWEKKYSYREDLETPDFKFYEDGKLRREVQQVDENAYYEYIYFPGGAEVKAKYVDGTKVEENMYLYGVK